MGRESLQFTKRRKSKKTGSSISSTQQAQIRKLQGRHRFEEEAFVPAAADEEAVLEEIVRIGVVSKASPALAQILKGLGIPAVVKGYIVERMSVPVGRDVPVRVSAQQRYEEAATVKMQTERKRQRLVELLYKQEAGFFDRDAETDVAKRILEREREELRNLLNDPEAATDFEGRDEMGRLRVRERGFPSYYHRKPPFNAKFREPRAPSLMKFNQSITSMAELLGPRAHNLGIPVSDGLREVVRADLLQATTGVFKMDAKRRSEAMRQLDAFLDDDDSDNDEPEEAGSVSPPAITPKRAYLERHFDEYCVTMNAQRTSATENMDAWRDWLKTPPASTDEPEEEAEQPASLLEDLMGEAERRTKHKSPKQRVDILDVQTELLFKRFLDTHKRFYSVYSFVGGDHQFTGIYEQLRDQPDKNVLDAHVYEQLQRKAARFEDILRVPRQSDTYFDAAFVHDMEQRTHTHLRQIIRDWLQRKPSNMQSIVREYLTRVRAVDCSAYRREWNRRFKAELEQKYTAMRAQHDAEMAEWKATQKRYERKDAGEANVEHEMRERLVLRVYNLERAMYEMVGESTMLYLAMAAPLLMALDSTHPIGKHSRMFRAKVLSGAYTIDHLHELTLAHLFTELVLSDADALIENYMSASHDTIQEELIRYFYKRNATIRRPSTMDAPTAHVPIPEPVRPQSMCLNENQIEDGDLILCKAANGYYCYSIRELTQLFGESDTVPIDPLTGVPFSQSLVEQITNRLT